MSDKLRALVIGSGSIGSQFDEVSSNKILTHAKAYKNSEHYTLVGLVDRDIDKVMLEAKKWETAYYSDLSIALKQGIDVVSICVPDFLHFDILMTLSQYPLKGIIAEKPLCKSYVETKKIIQLFSKVPIQVNFTRRFVSQYQMVRQFILSGIYGKLLHGSAWYGKGILHNGSHLIDLLTYFLGHPQIWTGHHKNYDFYDDDPSVDGRITFEKGEVELHQVDSSIVTIFEIDLMFEKNRVRITDLGYVIEIYTVTESPYFKGYKNYVLDQKIATDMDFAILNCVNNLAEHINESKPLLSPGSESLQTIQIGSELGRDK